MTLVMRSTPFCRPMLQMRKPMAHTTSIQAMSSLGLASMSEKTCAEAVLSAPSKVPVAIFTT